MLILLQSYAASEDETGQIIEVNNFPFDVLDVADSKPFKPEDLAGAEKAVIEADNRIIIDNPAEYPYSAIAYLDIHYVCRHEGTGTGFMVGEDLLVTAGHCFYCPLCHEPANEFSLYFGYLGARNYLIRLTDTNWRAWIVSGPVQEGKNYHQYDYGIIRLSEPVGRKTGYFSPRFNTPDQELSENSYHVAGYSGGVLRQDTDRIVPINDNFLRHYADMSSGDSGCPVFDDDYYVVAINTAEKSDGSENYAVRFTAQIQDVLKDKGLDSE